ncbi:MAG: CPCC family cysteine-rich protein [Acidobacteriota bacterium]
MTFVNVTKPQMADGSRYSCPCCGELTLWERGGEDICSVCKWQDDGQDDHDADEIRGGPNGDLSLTAARQSWRRLKRIFK